ncbi:MAG: DUF72 domain-containing protein [Thermoplasmata archaeon]
MTSVRVACCGWQYDDWVGPFYPESLRGRRGEWLAYYARYFDAVEVDSTFYSFPGERTVAAWIEKGRAIGRMLRGGGVGEGRNGGEHAGIVSGRGASQLVVSGASVIGIDSADAGGFEYSVKMHQDVTHAHLVRGSIDEAVSLAKDFETAVCRPLSDHGLLGAVLIQLSPHFHREGSGEKDACAGGGAGGRGGLEALKSILDGLDVDRYRYVVEFRHRSWLDGKGKEIHPEALALLRRKRVAVCILDSPGFPATRALTADHAYVRFHGRNYDLWYRKERPEGDLRINRYDYLYSDEELRPWAERVRRWMGSDRRAGGRAGNSDGEVEMEEAQTGERMGKGDDHACVAPASEVWAGTIDDYEARLREVRIAFNNHGHAKAVINGLRFRQMLGLGSRELRARPRTLDDFG